MASPRPARREPGAPPPAAFAPPLRSPRFHVVAAVVVTALGALGYAAARSTWSSEPARGYTAFGVTAAIVASALFLGVYLYVWRKRGAQEVLPGRLQTWLRMHVWLSVLGTLAALLHAGFHVDDGWGTLALAVLGFVMLSGTVGWWLYVSVPPRVDATVGNLAVPHTERAIRDLERTLSALEAGASDAFTAQVAALRSGRHAVGKAGRLAEGEAERLEQAQDLVRRLTAERARLSRQVRLKRWLRVWLWLHWPVACALPVVVTIHALDALEVGTQGRARAPGEHLDPLSCRECHPQQVDEWLTSMHAMAMSSPTVDLQHRLLVAVEQAHVARGGEPVAGDLCVKCHAPTGHHPGLAPRDEHEPLLARVTERAPASAYGISCVVCHQIGDVRAHAEFERLPRTQVVNPVDDLSTIAYRNIDNLLFAPGRTLRGAFGDAGEALPVGNGGHPSRFAPAFGRHGPAGAAGRAADSAFCASCHTVVVDRPDRALTHGDGEPAKLQNTFREWEEGGTDEGALNWSRAGVQCLDCHARDLAPVAREVRRMGDREGGGFLPLEQRRSRIVDLVRENAAGFLPGEDAFAALPRDGFDLPLPPRRRYRHAFTGVDHPLDDETPLLPGALGLSDGERRRANGALRLAMESDIDDLLAIAAAVEIDRVERGRVKGRILNLATGHHLPAGFAFARETWIEVRRQRGADVRVVAGGDGQGRSLAASDDLPESEKTREGFVNLQAVLWNGTERPAGSPYHREGETVIQIEVPKVLAGQQARDKGFTDRRGPILPGHLLAFDIACDVEPGDRVSVRLLFRGFPPRFLSELSRRLKATPGGPSGATAAEIERLGRLTRGLRIREMASDRR